MIELVLEDTSRSVADEFAIARLLNRKRKANRYKFVSDYRERKAAIGICITCTNPAKTGRRRCQCCTEKDKARVSGWRSEGRRRKGERL